MYSTSLHPKWKLHRKSGTGKVDGVQQQPRQKKLCFMTRVPHPSRAVSQRALFEDTVRLQDFPAAKIQGVSVSCQGVSCVFFSLWSNVLSVKQFLSWGSWQVSVPFYSTVCPHAPPYLHSNLSAFQLFLLNILFEQYLFFLPFSFSFLYSYFCCHQPAIQLWAFFYC